MLACFDHFVLISDPLMVSKFHNGIHDPKGQEHIIYTIIVFGMEMFERRHSPTRQAVVKSDMFLKCYPFGSIEYTKITESIGKLSLIVIYDIYRRLLKCHISKRYHFFVCLVPNDASTLLGH